MDPSGRGCIPTGLLDDLVGYWRLDDALGSTVAFDSSGRGNHGELQGLDAATAWVSGRSQGALEVAHTGWVQAPSSVSINAVVRDVTVSGWINLEGEVTPDDWGAAISRQTGTGKNQYYHLSLYLDGRPSVFFITDSGYALIKSTVPVKKEDWAHLAGVYDGATARLYVNGAEVAAQALTGNFKEDTTPVILGGNCNDASGVPNELFPGRLDELMLYARALSAAEVGQLAAGALFPKESMDAGGH